ncbi:unnamed protein product (macronuclear) [Paramecium tetraurelia]|uniref:Uncharacterized protein n=1 Tax=Paramecium tetraurelia TaxID=5888 RepID=A0EBW1_PARTE|nr:uncharacterized protein GSPATT00025513001 [Paramecium tetraurelia]CAK92778.1 unnamed protein product [Paramecium tetraurelia]|eukprot:XP_001460175.1 hypothetical protein (macronuclear) [Paramecium tetraurelia strain d4-2]
MFYEKFRGNNTCVNSVSRYDFVYNLQKQQNDGLMSCSNAQLNLIIINWSFTLRKQMLIIGSATILYYKLMIDSDFSQLVILLVIDLKTQCQLCLGVEVIAQNVVQSLEFVKQCFTRLCPNLLTNNYPQIPLIIRSRTIDLQ